MSEMRSSRVDVIYRLEKGTLTKILPKNVCRRCDVNKNDVVLDEKPDTLYLDRNRSLVCVVDPEEIPYGYKVRSVVIDVAVAVRLEN